MESNKTSIKLVGDASGIQDAAKKAKTAIAEIGKTSKQAKQDLKELKGVTSDLAGAFEGGAGQVANLASSLLSASGPIAILTTAITGLALAWKRSQENVDLYLKSADKTKFGTAGFTKDAGEARVDVRRRAGGEIARGLEIMRQAEYRLTYAKDLTKEQRVELELLKKHGYEMMVGGRALMDQVKGSKARVTFELEYSKLLYEQEKLKDSIKGIEEVRWKGMDTEFAKQRLISKEGKTQVEVDAAKLKAQELAKILLEEKGASLDKEIAITTKISEMTETQEVTEARIFELNLKKAALNEQYAMDLLKINRFMKDGITITKEQLAASKEFYSHGSAGYKNKGVEVNKKVIPKFGSKLTTGAPGIQAYGGLNVEEIAAMIKEGKLAAQIESMQGIVDSLSGAFENMFTAISAGSNTAFQDMAKAFGRSLQQMAAQLAGKAALFGILSLLSGGAGIVGQIASGLLGDKKLGQFMGLTSSIGGGGSLQLSGVLKGSDIYISGQRYANTLNTNT